MTEHLPCQRVECSIPALLHASTPVRVPAVAIIANDAGGVGKSLLALTLADWARFAGLKTRVVQVDDQGRLPALLGPGVVTIKIDPAEARRDRTVEQRAFTPIYDVMAAGAEEGALTIVELGANMAGKTALWLGMAGIAEELEKMGSAPILFTPYTTNAESMRLGARAASGILRALPAVHVMVENERDGRVDQLHKASPATSVYREEIAPLLESAVSMRMPSMLGQSWLPFESGSIRVLDAMQMTVDQVMQRSGLPLPEAKMARGDVAAFAGRCFDQFDRLVASKASPADA